MAEHLRPDKREHREVSEVFNELLACGDTDEGWSPRGPEAKGCGGRNWKAQRFPGQGPNDYLLTCQGCGWRLFVTVQATADLN
jgi:hypothetical protein